MTTMMMMMTTTMMMMLLLSMALSLSLPLMPLYDVRILVLPLAGRITTRAGVVSKWIASSLGGWENVWSGIGWTDICSVDGWIRGDIAVFSLSAEARVQSSEEEKMTIAAAKDAAQFELWMFADPFASPSRCRWTLWMRR